MDDKEDKYSTITSSEVNDVRMTQQMKRLLYLIAQLTKKDGQYGKLVVKDLPLKALIFRGILDKVLDYDYSPQSIYYIENRRYINVSQEGIDDLNDLRELHLLYKIRLATKRHFYIYSYGISKEGIRYLDKISEEDKSVVDKLVKCECGEIFDVIIKKTGIFLKCQNCGNIIDTEVTAIEDVPYKCTPISISTALTKKNYLGKRNY